MATETLRVEQVIAALDSAAGIVSAAALKLRVSSQTVRNYIKRHPEIAEALEQIRQDKLDLAETKLLQNIRSGKEASIFFFLKTQGKDRGYIERGELSGPNGQPIATTSVDFDPSRLSTEELLQYRELRKKGGHARPGTGGD